MIGVYTRDNWHENQFEKREKGNQELENWLRYLISKMPISKCTLLILAESILKCLLSRKQQKFPVTFEKLDYIRVDSYTKKIIEFPALQVQLWDKLRNQQFKDAYAISDIHCRTFPST